MRFEVFDISHVESPCDFSREFVVGDVEFLEWRIEGKNHVFFECFCCGIIDQVEGKVQVEDGCCHFEQLNEELRTT
jgi:hypothetical protein